jgi:hypothetical protein
LLVLSATSGTAADKSLEAAQKGQIVVSYAAYRYVKLWLVLHFEKPAREKKNPSADTFQLLS